jgi:hypothetical protein
MPFTLAGQATGSSPTLAAAWSLSSPSCILSWPYALLQSPPGVQPTLTSTNLRKDRLAQRLPPMRSLAPSASPRTKQRLFDWTSLPHRSACTFRFSQPHGASIRPVPGGLVSCHIRSWGCTLQSFAPPVQPYAVSGAHPALLSFKRPLTMPRAHRKRPKPTTIRSAAQLRRPKSTNTGLHRRQLAETTCFRTVSETGPRAPSPSGLCSTRKSATRHWLFRPTTST